MSFAPSSPVTGGAQTGLTSPTYTLIEDRPPAPHAKQYYVSALGGTQTGVEVSSLSNPFTIAMFKAANPKVLPAVNPVTGAINNVPRNKLSIVVRKGIEILADQPRNVSVLSCTFDMPAGSDVQDPESIRAALSLLIGTLSSNSAAIGDSLIGNNL